MSKKIELPKEKLEELYFDKEWSLKNVGDHFECSAKTVSREIERHGLETRDAYESYDINTNKLYELYYEKEKSLSDVAKYFDVSVAVITDRMNQQGWERRSGAPQNVSGENNPFYGKSHDEEARRKISEKNSGRTWEEMFDEETLEKQKEHIRNLKYWEREDREEFSEKYSGDNHWHSGKKLNDEHKRKIRKGVAEHYKEKSNKSYPNYNPEACELIEEYGEEHGYDFQHAENGGEYHIENIGCWLDGYDSEKNVVIEVYEKHHHYRGGELCDRDKFREQLIIEQLNCKFVRVSINRKGEIIKTKEVS